MWHSLTKSVALMVVLAAVSSAAVAQDDPVNLLRVHRPGTYSNVFSGDYVQVCYTTGSKPNDIRTLSVEIMGEAAKRVAVVTSFPAFLPGDTIPSGVPYEIIALVRAEKPGKSTIKVIPFLYDGTKAEAFTFDLEVVDRPR